MPKNVRAKLNSWKEGKSLTKQVLDSMSDDNVDVEKAVVGMEIFDGTNFPTPNSQVRQCLFYNDYFNVKWCQCWWTWRWRFWELIAASSPAQSSSDFDVGAVAVAVIHSSGRQYQYASYNAFGVKLELLPLMATPPPITRTDSISTASTTTPTSSVVLVGI